MPRKLRLEFPGAIYHVINRGNYRRDIFETDREKAAFEVCLFEACEKSKWLLHAFVLMINHFHLVVETPEANLVDGMKWLQGTFATRFNRYREVHGRLFQGRYKAYLVGENEPMGDVCDYTHLNPVKAGIVGVGELATYRYSSYWYLRHPEKRPPFLKVMTALECAGGIPDNPEGWAEYDVAGRQLRDASNAPKNAAWKLAISSWMKAHTQATSRWLSEQLHMGVPSALSRNLALYRQSTQPSDPLWKKLTSTSST